MSSKYVFINKAKRKKKWTCKKSLGTLGEQNLSSPRRLVKERRRRVLPSPHLHLLAVAAALGSGRTLRLPHVRFCPVDQTRESGRRRRGDGQGRQERDRNLPLPSWLNLDGGRCSTLEPRRRPELGGASGGGCMKHVGSTIENLEVGRREDLGRVKGGWQSLGFVAVGWNMSKEKYILTWRRTWW